MADNSTINSSMYTIVNVDANNQPTTVKPTNLPIATNAIIGAVRPDNTTITVDANGILTAIGGGGGGGGFSSVTSIWTAAGSATKQAYSTSPTINNDGITVTLVASSNPGVLPAWTVSLNGQALPNTYVATGSFAANYVVTIPVADIQNTTYQTAATVTVALQNSEFRVSGTALTNLQPIPFATTLVAAYVETLIAYYQSTATITYSYSNSNAITSFGGVINFTNTPLLPKNATSPSGNFASVNSGGGTISGTAIGNGTQGAPTGVTINLSGSFPAVPTYTQPFINKRLLARCPLGLRVPRKRLEQQQEPRLHIRLPAQLPNTTGLRLLPQLPKCLWSLALVMWRLTQISPIRPLSVALL